MQKKEILSKISFSPNEKYTVDVIYADLKSEIPQDVLDVLLDIKPGWKVIHHRKRVTYNKKSFVLTEKTKPGALVGIDLQYYNKAYPENIIV